MNVPLLLLLSPRLDMLYTSSVDNAASSSVSKDRKKAPSRNCSHGLRLRLWPVWMTRHNPLYVATIMLRPTRNNGKQKSRHHLDVFERMRIVARMVPQTTCATPALRRKSTFGLLPLQILQRMKFGCDCPRKVPSTMSWTREKAEGWVV